ncbi:hypothetical protein H8N00_03755 [Streptomyces sp. AC563]|uniref:hypothetical protein n=1 Tax=Streptomyces buecherae TaxID=2763006 RepID=UPI00164D14F4|nr:hypothetical protein [Streptomyces buecherae]MBC3988028.1 hypothetical protein [Streptomyces buecherae]
MSERRPGQWPVDKPITLVEPEPARRHTAARARFVVTLGAIRAALEEEPSEHAVRQAARRWQDALTALADEVCAEHRKAG